MPVVEDFIRDHLVPDLPTLQQWTVEDRCRFNSMALVSRLNDDVLLKIFMLNTFRGYEDSPPPSCTIRRISQVCQKWREFTLQSPMIWAASLNFEDPSPWIKEALSRAGSVPLNLTWRGYVGWAASLSTIYDDRLDLFLSLIHRSRVMYANIKTSQWNSVMQNLTLPAPDLRSFSLHLGFADKEYILPETLFNGHAPQFRILNLTGCSCRLSSPIFRNLTSLSVDKVASDFGQWLPALSGMPDLETLKITLTHFWERRPEGAPAPPPTVVLPRLQCIALMGTMSACSMVFTHVEFPSDCGIDLVCYDTAPDNHFYCMTSTLERILGSIKPINRKKDLYVMNAEATLGFTNGVYLSEGNRILSFQCHYLPDELGINITALFPPLLSLLRIAGSEVKTLCLSLNEEVGCIKGQFLAELLLSFQKVETLHIPNTLSFERLQLAMADNLQGEGQYPFFPALGSLSLNSIYFYQETDACHLQDLISRLFSVGRPLRSLEMFHCDGIDREAVEKIMQLGVAVSSDGKKISFEGAM
ncbi:hypothetical protein BDZ97DRAFT_2057173 [Flammula alnicola]|nr:hypothetical protein BDZ97DRAFT_2057173 [Flammula alnicola]